MRTKPPDKLPPGPKGASSSGNTFAYLRDPIGFLASTVRKHGDLVMLRLGNLTTYVLVNPEHIEYVLKTHADNFMKDKLTRWLIPLVGQGLLTSEGDFWRRQRRLAQPAFQRAQIERYAAVMVEHTEHMLSTWRDGQVRDVHEDFMRLTLSIVARTLFNTELAGEAGKIGESLEIVMNYFMSPMRWFGIREKIPAAFDPSLPAGDQADRRHCLRHHPTSGARAAKIRAIFCRAFWLRAMNRATE